MAIGACLEESSNISSSERLSSLSTDSSRVKPEVKQGFELADASFNFVSVLLLFVVCFFNHMVTLVSTEIWLLQISSYYDGPTLT